MVFLHKQHYNIFLLLLTNWFFFVKVFLTFIFLDVLDRADAPVMGSLWEFIIGTEVEIG